MPSKSRRGGKSSNGSRGKAVPPLPPPPPPPTPTVATPTKKKPWLIINSQGDLQINNSMSDNTRARENSSDTEPGPSFAAPALTPTLSSDSTSGFEASRSAASERTMASSSVSETPDLGLEKVASADAIESNDLPSASLEDVTYTISEADQSIHSDTTEVADATILLFDGDTEMNTSKEIESTSAPVLRILSLPENPYTTNPSLSTLPPDLLSAIFSHLDICSSFCLGVTATNLYPFHTSNYALTILLSSEVVVTTQEATTNDSQPQLPTTRIRYLHQLLTQWMQPDRNYEEVEPNLWKYVTPNEMELYKRGYSTRGIRELYQRQRRDKVEMEKKQKAFDDEFDAMWG